MVRKPKDLASLLGLTWKDFSIMIRVEAADKNGKCKCVTCGKEKHWQSGEIHAGHFLTFSGKNSPIRFEETNVYAQCKNCNTDGRVAWLRPFASTKEKAIQTRFVLHVAGLHGVEEVERLEQLRDENESRTGEERIAELKIMRTEYKLRAAKARKEKHI